MTVSNIISVLTANDFRNYFFGDSLLLSVVDKEIERAMRESSYLINDDLFDEDNLLIMAFYYLSAHYLALNKRSIGVNSVAENPIISESAEGVSASYQLPDVVVKSPMWASYFKTEYGARYVSIVWPLTVGNISATDSITT